MSDNAIKFLSFNEAVTAAKNEPGMEFIGLRYVAPFTRLDVYVIHVDAEEGDDVSIQFEGGELFDLGGEEEFYDLADVPNEAKGMFYARSSDLGNGDPQVLGMVSEHILQVVLPGLGEASNYKSDTAFIQAASTKFSSFWRRS